VARALLDRGYRNVHPMLGGFDLWVEKGYPVDAKLGEPQAT
jgi:rhodanese-related sulfurtransferase